MSTGLVTGAAGGIGSACVRALAGSAGLIVLSGRSREPLEQVVAGPDARTTVVAAEIATPCVNVIAPGVIETQFLGEATAALNPWVEERVPLGRPGIPDEVAELVRYLIVDAPQYLSGARIALDGGAETVT
jgi:NAD(P)-dependent dehydrogenase (short-subunit alcohol dehydrogenase family)